MESSVIAERRGTEVTGCPVMHHDFSKTRRAGRLLGAGQRAARDLPALLQQVRRGRLLGVHAPRRRPRHLQDPRDLLERVDHAVGAGSDLPVRTDPGRRPGPHQVPPDPEPVVLAEGDGGRGADDAGRPAAASSSRSCAKGECDFFEEFALRFPTAAFLTVIGVPISYTERVRGVGRRVLRRFRR